MELGSERVTTYLLVGLDLLAGLLLVVALVQPSGPVWRSWAVGAGFAACWLAVRIGVRVLGAPMDARGQWWPGGAAAAGLWRSGGLT